MTSITVQDFTSIDEQELSDLLQRLDPQSWPDGLKAGRAFYNRWGSPIPTDVTTREVALSGVKAFELAPPVADPGYVGLWFHGGAYIQGSQASHGGMVAELARASRCRFMHPMYRLAPDHPFPAAVTDGLWVYEKLLEQWQVPKKVIVGGDSAGGGLALAVLMKARQVGLPMPGRLVLFSPWVDLTCTGDTLTSNDGIDPLVSRQGCEAFAEMYLAGADPRDWAASPLWGDLTGMPNTLIQVGGREVLLSDSQRLHDRMVEARVPVSLEVWSSQIHVWQLHQTSLRQARQAVDLAGTFARGY